MERLDHILPRLLRKQPDRQFPVEDLVRANWSNLMGEHIAARTRVCRLLKDRLVVDVADANWQRQLARMQAQLVDRINQFLGRAAIVGLDLRVDAAIARSAGAGRAPVDGPPRKGPGQAAAIEQDLAQAAEAIPDPELRELFLRTSRKMLK